MIERARHQWQGASGATYGYYIYDIQQTFEDKQDGNYIYAKADRNHRWQPIYIGQGDLGQRVGSGHHKAASIRSKGATHVHVHLQANEPARLSEERDLLARFAQAYAPEGCNEKLGG